MTVTTTSQPTDHVVLLDRHMEPAGSMPKDVVHHDKTPLHLAVSCYLFDQHQRLFVSQRARTKHTWPGAITNSACGHPAPGETLHHAAHRIVRRELGCEIHRIATVLPHFRYRAVSPEKVVEWEYCPVIVATIDSREITLNPEEVDGGLWLNWKTFAELTQRHDTIGLSPWCKLQVAALRGAAPNEISDKTHQLPTYLK